MVRGMNSRLFRDFTLCIIIAPSYSSGSSSNANLKSSRIVPWVSRQPPLRQEICNLIEFTIVRQQYVGRKVLWWSLIFPLRTHGPGLHGLLHRNCLKRHEAARAARRRYGHTIPAESKKNIKGLRFMWYTSYSYQDLPDLIVVRISWRIRLQL